MLKEMIVCERLDDKRVIDKVSTSRVALLDIDYTVCDFDKGNDAGLKGIESVTGVEIASEVGNIFNLILNGHRNENLLNETEKKYFYELKEKFKTFNNNKVWSREVFIILAAEKLNIEINKDLVEKAADSYWMNLSANTPYYEDAIIFLEKIKENNIRIVWMTGSDSRLILTEKNGQIKTQYDAEFATKKKMERLKKLLNDYPGEVVIGDPNDKPSEEFFDRVFESVLDIKNEDIVAVGDSERNDLMVPRARGCSTVLVKR